VIKNEPLRTARFLPRGESPAAITGLSPTKFSLTTKIDEFFDFRDAQQAGRDCSGGSSLLQRQHIISACLHQSPKAAIAEVRAPQSDHYNRT